MESIDRRLILAGAGLAGVAALTKMAKAGPLNPPPGPIAPTGRTVQEIYEKIARTDVGLAEPRIPVQSLPGSATALHVISQPGSYYLTGNIEGVAGKNGIEILASGVTVDLAGHLMEGNGGLNGIIAPESYGNHVVRNGSVSHWQQRGLDLQGTVGNGAISTVESVVADGNGGGGIRLRYGRAFRCFAWGNGGNGIEGVISIVAECTAVSNASNGICAGFNSNVLDCNSTGNGNGYFVYGGTILTRCVADNNSGTGIGVGHECLVTDNQTRLNVRGIHVVNDKNRIENNNVVSAIDFGVLLEGGSNNFLIRNSVRGGTTPYQVGPGNSHGPIVNVAGVGNITSVPNANHPWANFIY